MFTSISWTYSGMYKDCINRQKQLEREESDGENAEEKLNVEKSDKNNSARKRKWKQIKVYVCTIYYFWTYVHVYVDWQ